MKVRTRKKFLTRGPNNLCACTVLRTLLAQYNRAAVANCEV
jgi:hypothetical protein